MIFFSENQLAHAVGGRVRMEKGGKKGEVGGMSFEKSPHLDAGL